MKIYHRIPRNIKGEYLMPLNKMNELDEDLYNSCANKYKGREALMEVIIPKLNCRWNDVIFFSPVHPISIKKAFENLGLSWKLNDWFEIDLNQLPDMSSKTIIYESNMKRKTDFSIDEEEVMYLNEINLSGLEVMPQRTLDYYQENKEKGFLLFHGIPHILYKGLIKIDSFNKIDLSNL